MKFYIGEFYYVIIYIFMSEYFIFFIFLVLIFLNIKIITGQSFKYCPLQADFFLLYIPLCSKCDIKLTLSNYNKKSF